MPSRRYLSREADSPELDELDRRSSDWEADARWRTVAAVCLGVVAGLVIVGGVIAFVTVLVP